MDTHSDHLERVGDNLPTQAELEEMGRAFDKMEAALPAPEPCACCLNLAGVKRNPRNLAGANDINTVPDHGFGFGL